MKSVFRNIPEFTELNVAGGNINEKDILGNTPLITLTKHYHDSMTDRVFAKQTRDMIKFLLKEGISYNITNNEGYDFKHYLPEDIRDEILEFLKEEIPVNVKSGKRN